MVDQSSESEPPAIQMSMLDFAAYMHAQLQPPPPADPPSADPLSADGDPLMLFEWQLPSELIEDIKPPSCFDGDLLSAAAFQGVCIHTHTHTHIYIYMCVCVCVCVYVYIYIFPLSLTPIVPMCHTRISPI